MDKKERFRFGPSTWTPPPPPDNDNEDLESDLSPIPDPYAEKEEDGVRFRYGEIYHEEQESSFSPLTFFLASLAAILILGGGLFVGGVLFSFMCSAPILPI